ncbi:MAG: NUDIX hydrolase [Gammaproteobacteria bacterium]|nr:NUDIX hydrolase [Gammaproteobacteria bacterium]
MPDSQTKQPQPAVGVIVFDDQQRVLLVQRGRPPALGLWSVPGGKVHFGESLAEACHREVLEETGLAVESGALIYHFEHMDAERHYVVLDFVARLLAPGQPVAGDDASAARWVALDDLQALPTTANLEAVVRLARSEVSGR